MVGSTHLTNADTYWHRDESQPDQWPLPKSRVIKSFVYLSDVGPEDGPLAVVRVFVPAFDSYILPIVGIQTTWVRRFLAHTVYSTGRGKRMAPLFSHR